MKVAFTRMSSNRKTGPIPTSTTSAVTCPDSCPLKGRGCYADGGPQAIHWRKVTEGERGYAWEEFCDTIRYLPPGTLWRHNVSGDLPNGAGGNETIDEEKLERLVRANAGKHGYTYTHKPVVNGPHAEANRRAISRANADGFTINLSANTLEEADKYMDLSVGPVTCILPSTVKGKVRTCTPRGHRIVVCPATYLDEVSCATCKVCSDPDRDYVVGFPAHGNRKKEVDKWASIVDAEALTPALS